MPRMQLNAGHKEDVPLKPAISRESVQNVSAVPATVEQQSSGQKSAGCSRGTRTSAAMLGLALSVGTSGAFLAQTGEVKAADASMVAPAVQTSQPLASVGSERPSGAEYHTVVEGETIWEIAKLHQVSVEAIKRANGFTDESIVKVGQVLKVPAGSVQPVVAAPAKSAVIEDVSALQVGDAAEAGVDDQAHAGSDTADAATSLAVLPQVQEEDSVTVTSIVSPGDTGSAADLGLPSLDADSAPVSRAADGNLTREPAPASTLASSSLENSPAQSQVPSTDGTPLAVGAVEPSRLPTAQVRHRVRAGDTLWSIARQYGVSPNELIQVNDIRNPNRIFVGRTLIVPDAAQPAPVATPSRESVEFAALEPFRLPSQGSSEAAVEIEPDALQPEAVPEALEADVDESAASDALAEADPYVANLLARVEVARDGATAEATASASEATDLASTDVAPEVTVATGHSELERVSSLNSTPINPQFLPDGDVPSAGEASTAADQELLAAAPLGSEVYAPINENPTGRVVSPDMPILPESGEYLPEAPNRFDGYTWPAQGVFTSGYGWRWGRMHRGIDIAGPVGTPIVAAAPGVVVRSGWNSGGYGNLVDIRHPDGSLTRYAHNSRLLVETGQQVRGGQQIAEMGSTGFSTGPHLHFEIHLPDQGTVNPMAYLPAQ
jgi:murein DD-endopeptidase MepM/ murein hydrolase activator NlpD